jgi:hypothetical protein
MGFGLCAVFLQPILSITWRSRVARQGLKPAVFGALDVAAAAATHKDYLREGF